MDLDHPRRGPIVEDSALAIGLLHKQPRLQRGRGRARKLHDRVALEKRESAGARDELGGGEMPRRDRQTDAECRPSGEPGPHIHPAAFRSLSSGTKSSAVPFMQ